MAFTLCSSGAIVVKAGKDINEAVQGNAVFLRAISEDAEGMICTTARYNFVSNYPAIRAASSFAEFFLANLASDLAAQKLIAYDVSGFPGKSYADNLINILNADAARGLRMLEDKKFVTFLGGS